MERRGHIARELCPDDGRGALVVLTPEGRSAIEQAAPGHVECVRQVMFDVLTSDQVEAFESVAQTVLNQIEASEPTTAGT
jgi:DNA-binding MarR family transcriptional regulator